MSRIHQTLKDFNKWELAYFVKYKLHTYTPETAENIVDYLKYKRKFTLDMVDGLIHEKQSKVFNDKEEYCPRCKTTKTQSEMVDWQIPAFHAGLEDEIATRNYFKSGESYKKEMVTCPVCDFRIKDPNKRTFLQKVFGFLFDLGRGGNGMVMGGIRDRLRDQ